MKFIDRIENMLWDEIGKLGYFILILKFTVIEVIIINF